MAEYTGHQVFQNMRARAKGVGSIDDAIAALDEVRDALKSAQFLGDVRENQLAAGWRGGAADAARAASRPVWDNFNETVEFLDRHQGSLRNQGSQFKGNAAALRDIPESAPEVRIWDGIALISGHAAESKLAQYVMDDQHNKQLYLEYHGATANNSGDLPHLYSNAPTVNSDVTVASATDPGGIHGPSHRPPESGGGGRGGDSGGSGGSGGGHTGGGYMGGPGPVGGPRRGPGRGWVPGVSRPPHGPVHAGPQPGGTTPQGSAPSPNPTMPGSARYVPPAASGGTGAGLELPIGGFGPGSGADGTGFGRAGGGGFGVRGPGLGGGVSGEANGGRAGAGRLGGGSVAEGTALGQRGASTVGGRAGSGMGGGPMGGAGGKKDKDTEHKSAEYLVSEENGDDIVGDMPKTAPPVIGG